MIRFLKSTCTVNLAVAICVAIGYMICGWAFNLPIDEHFLGSGPGYLGSLSGPSIPPWLLVLISESAIVAFFGFIQFTERDMRPHRLLCVVVGVSGLWMLFIPVLQILPPVSGEGDILARPDFATVFTLDGFLALYVWLSHILYAANGTIRNGRRHMIGELTSITNGPERNVRLVISPIEVCSEISEPSGNYDSGSIDHYELSGLQHHEHGLVLLTFVLADRQRVRFYCTHSKFDMVLLLDQLDATIGERRREVSRVDV